MTWEGFYLVCFVVGFVNMRVISVILLKGRSFAPEGAYFSRLFQ